MICANAMVILVIGFLSCTVHVAAKWKEYDGWHWHTFGDFTWLMDLKYTIRENEGFARTRDEPAERVKRLAERPKRTWISENPGKDECLRLRPGITELQYGYNQFYFRENPFDLFPDTSPLFRFTCKYIDSIDEDFQKPKQILRIKLSQEGVYQQVFRSSSMSFQEQIMSHYLKWTAATVGKVFRGKLDLQNETTTTTYEQSLFSVQLSDDLQPTEHITKQFNALLLPYAENCLSYHRFISVFGTHWRADAAFGGSIVMVTKHDSSFRKARIQLQQGDLNLNMDAYKFLLHQTNPHFSSDAVEETFESHGGLFTPETTLAEWIRTLSTALAIVSSIDTPISEIFRHYTPDDAKMMAFAQAMHDEEAHHTIKRAISVIKSLQTSPRIVLLALSFLEEELEYVRPAQTAVKTSKWILREAPKYSITQLQVTIRRKKLKFEGEFYIRSIWIPVFYGICTNVNKGHFNSHMDNIDAAEIHMPDPLKCLDLYKNHNCTDHLARIKSTFELEKMRGFSSFTICDVTAP